MQMVEMQVKSYLVAAALVIVQDHCHHRSSGRGLALLAYVAAVHQNLQACAHEPALKPNA